MILLLAAMIVQTQEVRVITDDDVNAVAKQMFCLECENIPLDVCGTQACIQWRAEIRRQLEAGSTPEDVFEYFRVNHGEHALAVPRDPLLWGLTNVTLWVMGALALILAIAFIVQRSRASRTQAVTAIATVDLPADYLKQLEQDIANR
ncbi:MAG: cytochrome c-type biogenesis protein [Phototrophicaceae bacterium]